MTSVHDVAAYILKSRGQMSAMKLQKLVYYAQAWSLVWDDAPLFPETIRAWVNGPVVRELYDLHRGAFLLGEWPAGNPKALKAKQRATVDGVLKFYGDRGSQWLSDLTHMETPWQQAREGLAADERGDREITHESMAEYYGGLLPKK